MPIMASQPIIQSQLNMMLSKGVSASQRDFASQITNVLTAIAPMGLMMMGLFPAPLVASGSSVCENIIRQALSMDVAANQEAVSMLMATGISLLVPTVPPVGLMALKAQIKLALSMKEAAMPEVFSAIVSLAIPQYFMMGGVI